MPIRTEPILHRHQKSPSVTTEISNSGLIRASLISIKIRGTCRAPSESFEVLAKQVRDHLWPAISISSEGLPIGGKDRTSDTHVDRVEPRKCSIPRERFKSPIDMDGNYGDGSSQQQMSDAGKKRLKHAVRRTPSFREPHNAFSALEQGFAH